MILLWENWVLVVVKKKKEKWSRFVSLSLDYYAIYGTVRNTPPQPLLSSGQNARKTTIGYLDGRTDLWTYGQTDGLMDRQTDRWKRQKRLGSTPIGLYLDGQNDGRKGRQMDRQGNKHKDRLTEGQTTEGH